ncbi:MAG TPA: nucleoside hydrolase [Rectinemataceae bacterium]|nr:nucleoside hydrolase [Rectinemataceae bacterium]
MNARRSILIDTDIAFGSPKADADDVLALILALSIPGLEIAAITPVGGNVSPEKASRNLHGFLSRIGRSFIPHAWSAAMPLDPRSRIRSEVWDRAWASEEKPAKPADAPKIDSVDLILKTLAEAPDPLTMVAIGPLTNLGRALAREPAIAAKIEEIVMMGGSREVRGLHGLAEFNIWADPAAAAVIFGSGLPVRVFGLDVTKKRKVLPQDLGPWAASDSPLVRDVHESVLGFMRFKAELYGQDYCAGYFHDAFPIAYFHKPGLFCFKPCRIAVGLEDDETYGVTSIDFDPAGGPEEAAAGGPRRFAVDVDDAALTEWVIQTIANKPACLADH